jgi:hypothetical protein
MILRLIVIFIPPKKDDKILEENKNKEDVGNIAKVGAIIRSTAGMALYHLINFAIFVAVVMALRFIIRLLIGGSMMNIHSFQYLSQPTMNLLLLKGS